VLSDADMSVKEDRPERIEESFEIFAGLGAADGGESVEKLLRTVGTVEIHPWLQALVEFYRTQTMTTAEFSSLMVKWAMFRSSMLSFMEKYDVIICPVCAYPAQPHEASITLEMIPGYSYTMTYNLTGWPGAVVRGGTSSEGLPIGVQIVARPWREDVALAVAKHLENVLGCWQRPLL